MPERTPLERSRIHRHRHFRNPSERIAPRAVIELDSRKLVGNFRAIGDLVPDHSLIPMIKADAYGHGAEWAAGLLQGESRLFGLGVATLQEGAQIRASLGARGRRTRIIVFSGAAPWTDEKGAYCERHQLTPVIGSDEDWRAFVKGGWPDRLPYQVKFNTGMNRLGLSPGMARQVVKSLQGLGATAHPEGILTHLAMSEAPESRLTQQQVERFKSIQSEVASAFPSAHFHLANSGAIWNAKQLGLKGFTDIIRPGLALYGVPPWADAPKKGLVPVLTLKASVISLRQIRPGESIGYGATFKVPSRSTESVRAAILSAGYADGVRRMLSNQGQGWVNGKFTRFLGIVSMDLSAVEAPTGTKVGDQVEILGPHIDPWIQARSAGTIPYELLTSMSARVERVYA